jgi:hypothetical protein
VKRAGGIGIATMALPPPPGATPPGQGGGGGAPQPVITLTDRDLQNLSGQVVSLSFTPRGAEKILAGTGHTLAELAQLVKESQPLPKFSVPGTLRMRAALTRDTFEAANVAALFEGSDPALKNDTSS